MSYDTKIDAVPLLARFEQFRRSVETHKRAHKSPEYDAGVINGIITAESLVADEVHQRTKNNVKVLVLDVDVQGDRSHFREVHTGADFTLSDLLDKEEIIIIRTRKI